jgi:predicted Rossmann fold nucleotide-binding protein DprA/Smf involved in DNA uptake
MINDAAYWIALGHLPGWRNERINTLILKFFHGQKIGIEGFFQLTEADWRNSYGLNDKEISDLIKAKSYIPNNSFLAESLLNQGYEIIPVTSPDYSKTLKDNLKIKYSPAVLYLKGNNKILHEKSVAIVGSRNASDISLRFTDNIAKLASKEYKVVVSGFAKGVDKQALDSAIGYMGQSIIVLPQGITTFSSGFKKYYRQIVDGDLLVLSIFHPKVPWRTDLAMARNPIIYGLADEIYVAESSDSGGTWSGVRDGLRKNRLIYVRKPEPAEKNANLLLIKMGAIPVDFNGKRVSEVYSARVTAEKPGIVEEPESGINETIKSILQNKPQSLKEIMEKLGTGWTKNSISRLLKTLDFIEIRKKGNKNLFILKGVTENREPTLF